MNHRRRKSRERWVGLISYSVFTCANPKLTFTRLLSLSDYVLLSTTLNWCLFLFIFPDPTHASSGFDPQFQKGKKKKTSPGSKTTRSEWHVECASWICAFQTVQFKMPQNDGCNVQKEKDKTMRDSNLFSRSTDKVIKTHPNIHQILHPSLVTAHHFIPFFIVSFTFRLSFSLLYFYFIPFSTTGHHFLCLFPSNIFLK